MITFCLLPFLIVTIVSSSSSSSSNAASSSRQHPQGYAIATNSGIKAAQNAVASRRATHRKLVGEGQCCRECVDPNQVDKTLLYSVECDEGLACDLATKTCSQRNSGNSDMDINDPGVLLPGIFEPPCVEKSIALHARMDYRYNSEAVTISDKGDGSLLFDFVANTAENLLYQAVCEQNDGVFMLQDFDASCQFDGRTTSANLEVVGHPRCYDAATPCVTDAERLRIFQHFAILSTEERYNADCTGELKREHPASSDMVDTRSNSLRANEDDSASSAVFRKAAIAMLAAAELCWLLL